MHSDLLLNVLNNVHLCKSLIHPTWNCTRSHISLYSIYQRLLISWRFNSPQITDRLCMRDTFMHGEKIWLFAFWLKFKSNSYAEHDTDTVCTQSEEIPLEMLLIWFLIQISTRIFILQEILWSEIERIIFILKNRVKVGIFRKKGKTFQF